MSRRCLSLALLTALLAASPAAARYVAIPSPGPGPAQYDRVFVDQVGPAKARRVLVLIPGTFGGSGDFALVARELVRRVPGLQVWSIDRRSNALEDTSFMVKALRREITSQQAFDYYIGWLGNDQIQPHYQPVADAEVQFAKRWGLAVAMQDTRRVVQAARRGGRRVILGGHSLGASSAYAYAAWDFAGRPGYRDLAGLMAIDGGGMRASADPDEARNAVDALEQEQSPWLDLLDIGLPWTSGVFQELGGIGALVEPDAPSIGQASPLVPAMFKPDVPVTNRALFGYAFDHRTSPEALALIHVRSGQVDRSGPEPHGWINDGITPIERLAKLAANEPGNFVEWYYPARLSLDVSASASLRRDEANDFLGNRVWHAPQVDLPLYAFQTSLSDGRVLAGARAFAAASQVRRATYVDRASTTSHLDPLAAAPRRNDFLETVVPWLRRLSGR